ncbi:MAG TPA: carbohydrate ABC transporter substrate-binding protein, partial [Halothiobacillaceae bacterium]|nr:carbohydrate ABC transporter substrate-binding protein [Halothiobacillaceae bacterium]
MLVILSLVLASCAQPAAPTPAATEPPAEEQPTEPPEEAEPGEAAEAPFPMVPGGFLERAVAGEFSGTTVVVDGPFTDADAIKFDQAMSAFEDATGITVNYIGSKEFEGSISIRVDAGDAPDIADFPQPGLLATFVRQGKIIDPTSFISEEWLAQQYNPSWLTMAEMEGQVAGVWHRFNAKSLVWYPKDDWDAAGYEIPETWDEMLALSDDIVSDGDAPWCVGIESGAATGWPATDWMEEVMLRTTSLENYDAWVAGELPFSSPEVTNAAETLGELWFTEGYVFGGRPAIVSTFFGDAPAPMFEDPPGCWLHKQGNFITGFFPEGSQAGVDYDFFYLPPIDEQYGKPFLVAGDIMAMFNDRPEVRALMEYFTLGESVEAWVKSGGTISPHNDSSLDWYADDISRGIAQAILDAETVRFDASDLMPGEVGAGAFWKAMTDYVSGSADLDTALAEIDDSWPDETRTTAGGEETAGEPGYLERARAGEFTGTQVSLLGPMVEVEAQLMDEVLLPFEEATGIDVVYEGTKEFEVAVNVRVDAGTPPDVIDFPQPGFLARLASQGLVVDVSEFLDEAALQANYNQGWLDMATMPGGDGEEIMAGVWHRTAGKSFVWYPKAQFEAAGYETPATWDELMALNQQIADDGDAPWCIGIESGAATGWVATDWIENILLRTTTPENYDRWVAGELPFASPEVKNAAETMAEIWLNPDYVYGGTAAIVSTFIGDSPVAMFEDPPACWFHMQAPWITGFFGEGLEAGVDYDFFTLPPIDEQYGTPVLVAGDIMAMFNDRPEVRALMEYFTLGESVEAWVKSGGTISPHNDSSLDWYADDIS